MNKRTVHFVFNSDYREEKASASFSTSISSYGLPIWPIPYDNAAFLACLKALGNEFRISIWVHLQAQEKNDNNLYAGRLFLETKFWKEFGKELTEKVRLVTRAEPSERDRSQTIRYNGESIQLILYHDTEMSKECLKEDFMVNVSDIKVGEVEQRDTEDDSVLRLKLNIDHPFLIHFLQGNQIDQVNTYLSEMKHFLSLFVNQSGVFWHEALLNIVGYSGKNPFDFHYWSFRRELIEDCFILNKTDPLFNQTLAKDFHKLKEDVRLNPETKQWEIKLNFFYAVSQRGEKIKDDFVWEGVLEEACALYVLHESLHQEHKLDYRTVAAIGNFPKTVEDADYQADAFAIMMEFCRFYYENQSENLSAIVMRKRLIRMIRVALETTFSFNPITELSGIQVRRVNRYLIWFYQIGLIEKEVKDSLAPEAALERIFSIISLKPVLEIRGPAIYVNKAKDRILYDLEDPERHKQELVLFRENIIVRHGSPEDLKLNDLVDGLKKSDYGKIYNYFSTLFWAKG